MRLFYGLSLPDDVRRCAASHAQQLAAQFPGRYVSEQNYHITLAFHEESEPDLKKTLHLKHHESHTHT